MIAAQSRATARYALHRRNVTTKKVSACREPTRRRQATGPQKTIQGIRKVSRVPSNVSLRSFHARGVLYWILGGGRGGLTAPVGYTAGNLRIWNERSEKGQADMCKSADHQETCALLSVPEVQKSTLRAPWGMRKMAYPPPSGLSARPRASSHWSSLLYKV